VPLGGMGEARGSPPAAEVPVERGVRRGKWVFLGLFMAIYAFN